MEFTILGSGGCMVIPKPLCRCRVCREARTKGAPYARTGPSAFLHDAALLIDTPAEIIRQLNRAGIDRIENLVFTHLDPDHVEGIRVVEQAAIDFRTWQAYPDKGIRLWIPEALADPLRRIGTHYGPLVDFYESRGFVEVIPFQEEIEPGGVHLTAIPVDRGDQTAFVLVLEKAGRRIVYAPCDIKPFPEDHPRVRGADLLLIQPGIFEDGLKHGFSFPADHISRTTLYTFEETLALARRIGAGRTVLIHLEEYWNRSHDDYLAIQAGLEDVWFAYDQMHLTV